MSDVKTDSQAIISSMKKSVANALERKRHLGQYAVITRNGTMVRLQPEEIKLLAATEDQAG